MSRAIRNLYPLIWQPYNLWIAYKQAALGKRARPAVATFEYDLEKELIELEGALRIHAYTSGVYHNFVIQKSKRRLISAAPFRDRVVHPHVPHAVLGEGSLGFRP